ncbi:glycoside hydrolase family 43 protein [Jaapia argillacea MUCL 33604]|uniref:Arabinan endo-1,5-alpha-L-arabinosidase n=1 Tax=Jaapia argillacea MUCL 33604 TaxID=933084 RepID=A0A067PRY9_9AGAM|nr:glycoside hydrolase family 43 protein [Jaapia argillacea MUCL 33604]
MRVELLSLVFAALCGLVVSQTFPDPLNITGPFFFVHDPSLVQRQTDGKYFLFTTHDKAGIITADNLAGPWTEVGSILPNNSSIPLPGRDDIWAPDVSYHNGQYYAYYSVSTFGSQDSGIGLATSYTMEPGSWFDHGLVINSTTGDNYNCIDPNLIVGLDGVPRLSFGSFWADIFQVELAYNFQNVTSVPEQISFNSTAPQAEEGSFVYKHGEYYYLFLSEGTCCGFNASNLPPPGDEYKVYVGRSISPAGPFVDAKGTPMTETGGTLVLASHGNVYAPGGQGLYYDTTWERDIFYYHYIPVESPDPYSDTWASLGLNGVDWSSGWPVLTSL